MPSFLRIIVTIIIWFPFWLVFGWFVIPDNKPDTPVPVISEKNSGYTLEGYFGKTPFFLKITPVYEQTEAERILGYLSSEDTIQEEKLRRMRESLKLQEWLAKP